jgi:RHS repeat-associated protein
LSNMPTLNEVCVWEIPFPPASIDVIIDGSPNVHFTIDCLAGDNEPSPSYTGPVYEGDPLTLIANPPDEGPYYFYWTGPNGFSSSEENPLVGTADLTDSGIYTLQMIDENDYEISVNINVDVVEDEIGMQYDDISLNYKDFSLYPFDFLCNSCCCDEEENSFGLLSPPELIEELSKQEKQTRPNVKGPPSCETEFNSYTGNFFVQVPILSFIGLGPEFSIDFAYNTCNTGINYGYGNGWTYNYNLVWAREGSDIHVFRGDGREDVFQFNAGYYNSPKGISDTLIDLGNEQFLLRSKYGMDYYFADSTHRRLTKVRDRNNNELIIDFTGSLATTITGACGRSFQLEYSKGHLTTIKDNNSNPSRSVRFEYDVNLNLTRITDPLGYAEDFIYDIDRLIVQLIDKRRNVVKVGYNSQHAVTSLESSISQIYVTYDTVNNQTIVTQPVGDSIQTTTYTFDGEGRATQISGSCCSFDIQYQYNSDNDITRITDAKGFEYNYTYDGRGNVLTETDPLNNIQEFKYGPQFNQLIKWEDKNGNIVSSSYDSSGNVTSISFSSGITWDYTYYDNGLLKTSTNGEGNTTNFAYNNCGNRTTIAHPIGTEFFEYDGTGNLIYSVTPNDDTTYYEFDVVRQLIKETDPLGNSIERFYDPNGNETWTKNTRGYITTRIYDAHNRLVKITGQQETITEFGYDEKGNMISRKDPNGNETQFTFDHRNLMISETNSLGHTRYLEYDTNGNLITETNYRGFSTTYIYDELNRKTSIVNALGDSTSYQYDANGNNLAVISPDGVASTFQYDEMDLLIKTQHAFDHSTNTYDKNGNLIEEEDALGNTTNYEYDANDGLIKVTDALGQQMTYQYDDNGNQIAVTDKMGNTDRTIYDALDRPILHINAQGDSVRINYDEAGNVKSITNERGFTTGLSYDELDRLVTIQYPIGIRSYDYDKKGNQIKETDALGRITSFEYDASDQLIETRYPDGSSSKNNWDENGNRIMFTNEENATDQFTYDALDRLASSTNAENETTSLTYDNLGNKKIVTLPSGNVIQYVYDKENRPFASYDKLGRISKNTYDLLGNIITESDGNGNTITHQYDALGHIIATIDQKGDISQYAYDKNDNLLQTIDREGFVTMQSYDALNRSTSQTDALGNATSYSYDKTGNIISITDANGNTTAYEYDANDRLTKETYADGTTKVYTYNVFGNVISRTDNNGIVTSYNYDDRNRLILINYPGANDDHFAYDLSGLLTSASNTNANLSFGYDKADRLLFETINGITTSYMYDAPGQKRTINYSGGNHIVVETMDKRGRLKQLQRNGNIIANWFYDGGDRRISRNYANGTKNHNAYNASNWITSLKHSNASVNIVHLIYAFDNEGNKQYEYKTHRPDRSENYAYDNIYRLTEFKRGNIATGSFTFQKTFNYDPLGNRKQVNTDGILTTYASNEMNEYTSISGISDPVYDANGNLIEDGTFTYQYDYENRLTSVNSGGIAIYEYDPLGRRISKTTTAGTTRYFYDGARVIQEKDGSGNLKASYLYGAWIDDIIVMQRGVNDYYYHTNSQGSVIALTNTSGNPEEYYEYDAYGKVKFFDNNYSELSNSAVGNPYLFTGRRLDEEIGLYYYRYRYYEPNHGRYISRDPIGIWADNKNLGNGYTYVGNNTKNFIDPYGLTTVTVNVNPIYDKDFKPGNIDFPSRERVKVQGRTTYVPVKAEDIKLNWRIDGKNCPIGCKQYILDDIIVKLDINIQSEYKNEAVAKHEMKHAQQYQQFVEAAFRRYKHFATDCKRKMEDLDRIKRQQSDRIKTEVSGRVNIALRKLYSKMKIGSKGEHKKNKYEKQARAAETQNWIEDMKRPPEFVEKR